MNTRLPHDYLIEHIRQLTSQAHQHRQVADRLRKLLPERLKSVKQGLQTQMSAGRATRHALNSDEYLGFMTQYLDVYTEALHARIQCETHRMLVDARRSLRAFHRP